MRHCLVCRKRQALQEVSFEQSLMFLCNICFSRIEMDHATYYEDQGEEFEDQEDTPNTGFLSYLHKEKRIH